MKRRDVMKGSGSIVLALLAGRTVTAQEDVEPKQVTNDAMGLLPAPSELDSEYVRIVRTTLPDEEDALAPGSRVVEKIDDLDDSDVEYVVTAWTENERSLGGFKGSFERLEAGEDVSTHGSWRVGDIADEELAIASTDDLAMFSENSDEETRVELAETGYQVGTGDSKAALDNIDTLDTAFDRLREYKAFYYVPVTDSGFPTVARDQLATVCAGFEARPSTIRGREGTLENEFVLEEAEDADLDEENVEEIIRELEQGTIVEIDVEFEDNLAFVSTVIDAPPERSREESPDADIRMEANPSEGTASIEHKSGEKVPAEALELWVNGELVEEQPADRLDTFEAGDSFTVDTGPLANVYLRWVNENGTKYFGYVNDVVGEDAFETSYDPAAETVELTYTGEAEADPGVLTLERRKRINEGDNQWRYEREELTAPLESLDGSLTNGDSIVVDNVELEDAVTLSLETPSKPPGVFGPDTTLVRFHARPPRLYITRQPNKPPVVEYVDDQEHDADELRIMVDGSEADTQLADEHDTLKRGDRTQLDGVEIGSKITVEWVAGDESVVVEEFVVEPQAWFEVTYNDEDGTVTVKHANGEEVDAGSLELLVGGEQADTQPEDEYDVVSKGDAITVTAEPFTRVKVRWVQDEWERTLTETITGEGLFEASYDIDAETVELTYTGQQSADPERLGIDLFGAGTGADSGVETTFADEYDTLTNGDSVTIEDVGPEMAVQVVLKDVDGHHRRDIFWYRPKPYHVFSFENRDGTLVAKYGAENPRDADQFRILVDGSEFETQPDDEYDTLEKGDELKLGSFEPGTTVVVQWPAGNDPTELQQHVVVPDAEFDATYDEDEEVVRVEYGDGDEIKAEDIGLYIPGVTDDLVTWEGEGTLSEGDSMTIEAEERPSRVIVVYREERTLAEIQFDE
jgi:hypothetical protein